MIYSYIWNKSSFTENQNRKEVKQISVHAIERMHKNILLFIEDEKHKFSPGRKWKINQSVFWNNKYV